MFRSTCVFLASLSCIVASSSAQPVLDQSFTSPANYAGFDSSINACCAFVAQTYTAGLTGTLAGVSISIESQSAFPLHVAIRTVTSGVPTTTVLGDVTLSSSSSQLSDLIVFPQLIQQVAGVQYAIVVNYLGAPPPSQAADQGNWSGASSPNFTSLYPGGENTGSVDGISWMPVVGPVFGDLFFKTFVASPILPIAIDIKPGSFPNPINTFSRGRIPVAILSSASFNAPGSVVISSLTFGQTGSEKSLAFCNTSWEDVNGDGLPDLVCHFNTQQADFQQGDTVGILRASTLDGRAVLGTDSIKVVY